MSGMARHSGAEEREDATAPYTDAQMLDRHVHKAEKYECRVIMLTIVLCAVVFSLARLGLRHSKREKMGPARPLKRRICCLTLILVALSAVIVN